AGNPNSGTSGENSYVIDNTPPTISAVEFSPTSGWRKAGDTINMTITSDATGYTAGAITVNGNSTSGFTDNGDNTYTVTYTVSSGDTNRLDSDQIPVSAVLVDVAENPSAAYVTSPAAGSTPAIDTTVPTIYFDSVAVTPDDFVCALDGAGSANANFTIRVNVSDFNYAALEFVNVSLVSHYSAVDFGEHAMSYVAGLGLWEVNISITDTSMIDGFEDVNITILTDDLAGNGFTTSGSFSAVLIVYNMTQPDDAGGSCERNGAATTNFCNLLDFEHVNFTTEIERNGSQACNPETDSGLPWNNSFSKVITITFFDINFSESDIGSELSSIGGAIMPYITGPGSFEESYIYVNVSSFERLNKTTDITLYGLPFAEEPTIAGEGAVSNIVFTQSTPYDIGGAGFYVPNATLSFRVDHFSQYNISDLADPIVTVNSPANESSLAESYVVVNFTANGTGTQLSNILLLYDDVEVESWDTYDQFDECINLTPDWDVVNCIYNITSFSGGEHNVTITAFDYGGGAAPGLSSSTLVTFSRDNIPPTTNANYTSNIWMNNDISIELTPVDVASGVNYTSYSVDGGAWANGTTVSVTTDGNHTLNYYSVDNLGNVETVNTLYVVRDSVSPVMTNSSYTGGWVAGSVAVTFNRADALSGIDYTSYKLDSGDWTNGTSVTVTGTKNHTLLFYSVDNAGNVEATRTQYILIDVSAPVTVIKAKNSTGDDFALESWYNGSYPLNISINLTASDLYNGVDNGASVSYCSDTSNTCTPSSLYTGVFNVTASGGITYIRYRSNDSLANFAATKVSRIMVLSDEDQVINSSTLTVDENKTTIVIPTTTSFSEVNITVPDGLEAELEVSELLNTTTYEAELEDNITVTANTTGGVMTVSFPSGMVITGTSEWNGTINLPKVRPVSSVTATADAGYTATVDFVLELGAEDVPLSFDKAVRLNMTGKAGKRVGFYRSGSFSQISIACAADSQAAGDALAANGTCKIDVGDDLIIWTKHFTRFVTYTQAVTPTQTNPASTSTTTSMRPPDTTSLGDVSRTYIYDLMQKGEKRIDVDIATGFTGLTLVMGKDSSDVKFVFSRTSNPEAEYSAGVYSYLTIEHTNLADDAVSSAKIRFAVMKTWISENGLSGSEVYLARYSDGSWGKLKTTQLSDDSIYIYYEAESPGLSLFAVSAGEEPAAPVESGAAESATTPGVDAVTGSTVDSAQASDTTGLEPAEQQGQAASSVLQDSSKTGSMMIYLIIGLVILVAIVAYIYHKRSY
ncbi:PGF-pre-PGF domain-containing protein, partial [Candidatus Woesearchaeota archaeon]|nr:PGF-pre-PGF domain-containing protein [Candidatus Woesearchaeota archaeon]